MSIAPVYYYDVSTYVFICNILEKQSEKFYKRKHNSNYNH